MKRVYRISCWSNCGSYFMPYLKSVTVIADSENHALSLVKEWLEKEDRKFIYPESKWQVVDLCEVKDGVVDFEESADY